MSETAERDGSGRHARAGDPRRPPSTGARRAAARRRRDLRWLPIALAIWVASFAAIPAVVLLHQALSEPATTVRTVSDDREDGTPPPAPPATAAPGTGQQPAPADGVEPRTVTSAAPTVEDTPVPAPVVETPAADTGTPEATAPETTSSAPATSSSPASSAATTSSVAATGTTVVRPTPEPSAATCTTACPGG